MATSDPLLYTLREAAEQLRVGLTTVEKHVSNGDIEVVRIGRSVRIRPAALQRFIEARIDPGQTAPLGRTRRISA